MTLTFRDEKGSQLTHAEMDENLRHLRDQVPEIDNIKFTTEGGLAVRMINKTGLPSVKGMLVTPGSDTDLGVVLVPVDSADTVGIIYDTDVADGEYIWVVVAGMADVLFSGGSTRGHLARSGVTSDGVSDGVAISELYPTSPFATDKHFCEIGHVLESRVGAGLARCVLHFN